MSDTRKPDDETVDVEQQEHVLQQGAAPNRVGVYERPERTVSSQAWIAIIAVVLLLVVAVVVYMLMF